MSPPSYPYPHFVCGSLHHRRCLTYLPPLPDPVHLGTGWPSDGGGSSFPGVSERGCDPCRVRILSGTSSWSTPFLPPAEPLRKGANEPRLLLPEELGRVILVVQARLEPPQEPASVPGHQSILGAAGPVCQPGPPSSSQHRHSGGRTEGLGRPCGWEREVAKPMHWTPVFTQDLATHSSHVFVSPPSTGQV